MILNKLLSPIGGCFVLHWNLDISKLKILLPASYNWGVSQCVVGFKREKPSSPQEVQEVLNETIWNNKLLCVDKKCSYRKDLIDLD